MPADFFAPRNRKTVRSPVNPMDKSTLVSILPFEVDEKKPTIFPGRFKVPAGTIESPGVLVVGPSSWWREIDEKQPLLEIPVSSYNVADSIVRDFCIAQLGCNMGDKKPGIFFLLGALDKKTILEKHQSELKAAEEKQKNWYLALVKVADVLWSRTSGNPLAISNDARHAAKFLQLDKPWMQDFKTMQMQNCPACGTLRANQFPVCANCKTILDPERYKALGLKQAV
jgi:hypothetical protein